MSNVNVKIKLTRGMEMPKYATGGSAALDLCAALDEGETVVLAPGERRIIPTGISIAPERNDVVAVVAARSGLGIKKGICLSNGIGVIDSDYRGEIFFSAANISDEDYTVSPGERVAQMMIMPVLTANFIVCDELDETERGAGGFGSTGKI